MGAANQKNQIGRINLGEWMNIGIDNEAQIVKSNLGNGEGQIRVIPLDPKNQIPKQMKIYTYRKNTQTPLVKCLGVEFSKSQSKSVCGIQQVAKVLTQRIPNRLSNIKQLTLPQSLYVLSQSLIGFSDLNEKAGRFQINENMIGFDKNAKVKVWLNQNFAMNHPSFERPILQTSATTDLFSGSSQQKMVQSLVSMVQNKYQSKSFPPQLDNILTKSKKFDEAYNNIQKYIDQKKIPIVEHVGEKQVKNIQQNNTNRITVLTNQRQSRINNSIQNNQIKRSISTSPRAINSLIRPIQTVTPNLPSFSAISPPPPVSSGRSHTYFATNQVRYPMHQPSININNANISTGNSYGFTQYQQPYKFGIVNSPIMSGSTNRIAVPSVHKVSFNYPQPTTIQGSQVVRHF